MIYVPQLSCPLYYKQLHFEDYKGYQLHLLDSTQKIHVYTYVRNISYSNNLIHKINTFNVHALRNLLRSYVMKIPTLVFIAAPEILILTIYVCKY